ncbi:MAG: OmpA family protein [Pseudomonadota bacterium]
MKFFTKALLILSAFLFLFGCASKQMAPLPEFNAVTFDKNNYTSRVDTFLILFDASSSMSHDSAGYNKFQVAKAVAERMNATLPELSQIGGLRSFGHSPKVSSQGTELFFGMGRYTTAGLKAGLDKITEAGGPSPMNTAIDEAVLDFDGFDNASKAVIFITDGLDMPGDILKSAKALKARYGDSICFYPILVGNDPKGDKLLKNIEIIGSCGFSYNAADLLTSEGMADFIETVFLKDRPAAKPAPVPAPMKKDTDKDGVYDDDDKCPNTPMGAKVNSDGCWVLNNVLFDFDKDEIKPEAYPLLKDVAVVLKQNYKMNVELAGHCDNQGTEAYNKGLSLRRAEAVKTYLNGQGVVLSRMTTKGFGFSKPVTSNTSEAGRALNRRVEINPID